MRKAAMKTAKIALQAGAAIASGKAKKAAARKMKQLAVTLDEALVKAGHAAERRQTKRARKAALKTAGKVALVAGGAAITIAAARAMARRGRSGSIT
jgi:hypothetical protein